jgi:MraZ protein
VVQSAHSYSGWGFSLQGDKGRFVLPPAIRKVVKASGDGQKTLCLDKHSRFPCLIGFGLSRLDLLAGEIDREEQLARDRQEAFDRDLRYMQLYGFSETPFDDSGRFVLPRHLTELAEIGDGIYFHGSGPFFMLWNPAVLAAMDGAGWESAKANCRAAEASARGKKA